MRNPTKTIKQYPNLSNIVLYDIENAENQESYIKDVLNHGCQSGTVSSLIYYTDTQKFFDNNYEEIMDLVYEYEQSTGEKLKWDGDLKNWFAWFAYEEIIRMIADELGIEY